MTLCLIFIQVSKQSPPDGWPNGNISKAFILSLAAPFELRAPASQAGSMKGGNTESPIFSAERPRGQFRASGKQSSFQSLVVSQLVFFLLFFFKHEP